MSEINLEELKKRINKLEKRIDFIEETWQTDWDYVKEMLVLLRNSLQRNTVAINKEILRQKRKLDKDNLDDE